MNNQLKRFFACFNVLILLIQLLTPFSYLPSNQIQAAEPRQCLEEDDYGKCLKWAPLPSITPKPSNTPIPTKSPIPVAAKGCGADQSVSVGSYACVDNYECVQCESSGLFSKSRTTGSSCPKQCQNDKPATPPVPAPTTPQNKPDPACTYWCAGCGGFCGDDGVKNGEGGCNIQQKNKCDEKPCYETGTCTTLAQVNPETCKNLDGSKCLNGYENTRLHNGQKQTLVSWNKDTCPDGSKPVTGRCWVNPATQITQKEFDNMSNADRLVVGKMVQEIQADQKKAEEDRNQANNVAQEIGKCIDSGGSKESCTQRIAGKSGRYTEDQMKQINSVLSADEAMDAYLACKQDPKKCGQFNKVFNGLDETAKSLFNPQKESFDKINKLSSKLQRCASSPNPETCQDEVSLEHTTSMSQAEINAAFNQAEAVLAEKERNRKLTTEYNVALNTPAGKTELDRRVNECRSKMSKQGVPQNIIDTECGTDNLRKQAYNKVNEINPEAGTQVADAIKKEKMFNAAINGSKQAMDDLFEKDKELYHLAVVEKDKQQRLKELNNNTQAILNWDREKLQSSCKEDKYYIRNVSAVGCADVGRYAQYLIDKNQKDILKENPELNQALTKTVTVVGALDSQLTSWAIDEVRSTAALKGNTSDTAASQVLKGLVNNGFEKTNTCSGMGMTLDLKSNNCVSKNDKGEVTQAVNLGTRNQPTTSFFFFKACNAPGEHYDSASNSCRKDDPMADFTTKKTADGSIQCKDGYRRNSNILSQTVCVPIASEADEKRTGVEHFFNDNFNAEKGSNIGAMFSKQDELATALKDPSVNKMYTDLQPVQKALDAYNACELAKSYDTTGVTAYDCDKYKSKADTALAALAQKDDTYKDLTAKDIAVLSDPDKLLIATQLKDDLSAKEVAAFLKNSQDLSGLGEGGLQAYINDVNEGKITATELDANLTEIKKDGKAAALIAFNNFTNGAAYRGNQLQMQALNTLNSTGDIGERGKAIWDYTRGTFIMSAKPAATAVMIAAVPLAPIALGAAPLTLGTAMTVGGTAFGVSNTANSLGGIGESCGQADAACGFAVANTAFSAASTAVGVVGGNNVLTQALMKASPEFSGVMLASQAGGNLAKNADKLVNAGIQSMRAAESPIFQVANKAVAAGGMALFGGQAAYQVSQTGECDFNCAMNIGMAITSAGRLFTPVKPLPGTNYSAKVAQSADAVSDAIDGVQAAAACAGMLQGKATSDECAQALAGAGISAGNRVAGGRQSTADYWDEVKKIPGTADVMQKAGVDPANDSPTVRLEKIKNYVENTSKKGFGAVAAVADPLTPEMRLAADKLLRGAIADNITFGTRLQGALDPIKGRQENLRLSEMNQLELQKAYNELLKDANHQKALKGKVNDPARIAAEQKQSQLEQALIAGKDAIEIEKALLKNPRTNAEGKKALEDAKKALADATKSGDVEAYQKAVENLATVREQAAAMATPTLPERVRSTFTEPRTGEPRTGIAGLIDRLNPAERARVKEMKAVNSELADAETRLRAIEKEITNEYRDDQLAKLKDEQIDLQRKQRELAAKDAGLRGGIRVKAGDEIRVGGGTLKIEPGKEIIVTTADGRLIQRTVIEADSSFVLTHGERIAVVDRGVIRQRVGETVDLGTGPIYAAAKAIPNGQLSIVTKRQTLADRVNQIRNFIDPTRFARTELAEINKNIESLNKKVADAQEKLRSVAPGDNVTRAQIQAEIDQAKLALQSLNARQETLKQMLGSRPSIGDRIAQIRNAVDPMRVVRTELAQVNKNIETINNNLSAAKEALRTVTVGDNVTRTRLEAEIKKLENDLTPLKNRQQELQQKIADNPNIIRRAANVIASVKLPKPSIKLSNPFAPKPIKVTVSADSPIKIRTRGGSIEAPVGKDLIFIDKNNKAITIYVEAGKTIEFPLNAERVVVMDHDVSKNWGESEWRGFLASKNDSAAIQGRVRLQGPTIAERAAKVRDFIDPMRSTRTELTQINKNIDELNNKLISAEEALRGAAAGDNVVRAKLQAEIDKIKLDLQPLQARQQTLEQQLAARPSIARRAIAAVSTLRLPKVSIKLPAVKLPQIHLSNPFAPRPVKVTATADQPIRLRTNAGPIELPVGKKAIFIDASGKRVGDIITIEAGKQVELPPRAHKVIVAEAGDYTDATFLSKDFNWTPIENGKAPTLANGRVRLQGPTFGERVAQVRNVVDPLRPVRQELQTVVKDIDALNAKLAAAQEKLNTAGSDNVARQAAQTEIDKIKLDLQPLQARQQTLEQQLAARPSIARRAIAAVSTLRLPKVSIKLPAVKLPQIHLSNPFAPRPVKVTATADQPIRLRTQNGTLEVPAGKDLVFLDKDNNATVIEVEAGKQIELPVNAQKVVVMDRGVAKTWGKSEWSGYSSSASFTGKSINGRVRLQEPTLAETFNRIVEPIRERLLTSREVRQKLNDIKDIQNQIEAKQREIETSYKDKVDGIESKIEEQRTKVEELQAKKQVIIDEYKGKKQPTEIQKQLADINKEIKTANTEINNLQKNLKQAKTDAATQKNALEAEIDVLRQQEAQNRAELAKLDPRRAIPQQERYLKELDTLKRGIQDEIISYKDNFEYEPGKYLGDLFIESRAARDVGDTARLAEIDAITARAKQQMEADPIYQDMQKRLTGINTKTTEAQAQLDQMKKDNSIWTKLVPTRAQKPAANQTAGSPVTLKLSNDQPVNQVQESLAKINSEQAELIALGAKPNRTDDENARLDALRQKFERSVLGVSTVESVNKGKAAAEIDATFKEMVKKGPSTEIKKLQDLHRQISEAREAVRLENIPEAQRTREQNARLRKLTKNRDIEGLIEQYNAALDQVRETALANGPDGLNRLSEIQAKLQQIDTLNEIKTLQQKVAIEKAKGSAADQKVIDGLNKDIKNLTAKKEIIIPADAGVSEEVRLKLTNIVRDTEHRLAMFEDGSRASRANQIDTLQKLLSGNLEGVELTTAGGKTMVGAMALKARTEVFGNDTGVYISKEGSQDPIRTQLDKMTSSTSKVVVLDVQKLNDPAYVKDLLAAKYIVTGPNDINFLQNNVLDPTNPTYKSSVDVLQKMTRNVSVYADEAQLTLDPNVAGINQKGDGVVASAVKESAAADVAQVLSSQGILKAGDNKAHQNWNGENALVTEITAPDGSKIHASRFSEKAEAAIFSDLRTKNPVGGEFFDKINSNRDAVEALVKQGGDGSEAALEALTGSRNMDAANQVLEQINMVNVYAKSIEAEYFRQIDSKLAEQNGGRYQKEVSIPASNGVVSEGQTFSGDMNIVMEHVGAIRKGQSADVAGLSTTSNSAYKSTVTDYITQVVSDPQNGMMAVTGTLGGNRGVVETAIGMRIHANSDAVVKIVNDTNANDGRLINSKNGHAVADDADAMALLSDAVAAGKMNTSNGMAANGNAKIAYSVKNMDGIEVARAWDKGRRASGNTDTTYVVKEGGDKYYEIKLNDKGEVVSKVETSAAKVQQRYQSGEQNLVTIIDRGGATGDSIKTPENVPFVPITFKGDPTYNVAQLGARGNRGNTNDMETFAIIIGGTDARLPAGSPADRVAAANGNFDFQSWRKGMEVEEARVNKDNVASILNDRVMAQSRAPMADLVNATDDTAIKTWASDVLLKKFLTNEQGRDLSSADGAELNIDRRNKIAKAQSEAWQRIFEDPNNQAMLTRIQQEQPEIYARMVANRDFNKNYPNGYEYAAVRTAASNGRDTFLMAGDMASGAESHRRMVVADSESAYVARTETRPMQVAQNNITSTPTAKRNLNVDLSTLKVTDGYDANGTWKGIGGWAGDVIGRHSATTKAINNLKQAITQGVVADRATAIERVNAIPGLSASQKQVIINGPFVSALPDISDTNENVVDASQSQEELEPTTRAIVPVGQPVDVQQSPNGPGSLLTPEQVADRNRQVQDQIDQAANERNDKESQERLDAEQQRQQQLIDQANKANEEFDRRAKEVMAAREQIEQGLAEVRSRIPNGSIPLLLPGPMAPAAAVAEVVIETVAEVAGPELVDDLSGLFGLFDDKVDSAPSDTTDQPQENQSLQDMELTPEQQQTAEDAFRQKLKMELKDGMPAFQQLVNAFAPQGNTQQTKEINRLVEQALGNLFSEKSIAEVGIDHLSEVGQIEAILYEVGLTRTKAQELGLSRNEYDAKLQALAEQVGEKVYTLKQEQIKQAEQQAAKELRRNQDIQELREAWIRSARTGLNNSMPLIPGMNIIVGITDTGAWALDAVIGNNTQLPDSIQMLNQVFGRNQKPSKGPAQMTGSSTQKQAQKAKSQQTSAQYQQLQEQIKLQRQQASAAIGHLTQDGARSVLAEIDEYEILRTSGELAQLNAMLNQQVQEAEAQAEKEWLQQLEADRRAEIERQRQEQLDKIHELLSQLNLVDRANIDSNDPAVLAAIIQANITMLTALQVDYNSWLNQLSDAVVGINQTQTDVIDIATRMQARGSIDNLAVEALFNAVVKDEDGQIDQNQLNHLVDIFDQWIVAQQKRLSSDEESIAQIQKRLVELRDGQANAELAAELRLTTGHILNTLQHSNGWGLTDQNLRNLLEEMSTTSSVNVNGLLSLIQKLKPYTATEIEGKNTMASTLKQGLEEERDHLANQMVQRLRQTESQISGRFNINGMTPEGRLDEIIQNWQSNLRQGYGSKEELINELEQLKNWVGRVGDAFQAQWEADEVMSSISYAINDLSDMFEINHRLQASSLDKWFNDAIKTLAETNKIQESAIDTQIKSKWGSRNDALATLMKKVIRYNSSAIDEGELVQFVAELTNGLNRTSDEQVASEVTRLITQINQLIQNQISTHPLTSPLWKQLEQLVYGWDTRHHLDRKIDDQKQSEQILEEISIELKEIDTLRERLTMLQKQIQLINAAANSQANQIDIARVNAELTALQEIQELINLLEQEQTPEATTKENSLSDDSGKDILAIVPVGQPIDIQQSPNEASRLLTPNEVADRNRQVQDQITKAVDERIGKERREALVDAWINSARTGLNNSMPLMPWMSTIWEITDVESWVWDGMVGKTNLPQPISDTLDFVFGRNQPSSAGQSNSESQFNKPVAKPTVSLEERRRADMERFKTESPYDAAPLQIDVMSSVEHVITENGWHERHWTSNWAMIRTSETPMGETGANRPIHSQDEAGIVETESSIGIFTADGVGSGTNPARAAEEAVKTAVDLMRQGETNFFNIALEAQRGIKEMYGTTEFVNLMITHLETYPIADDPNNFVRNVLIQGLKDIKSGKNRKVMTSTTFAGAIIDKKTGRLNVHVMGDGHVWVIRNGKVIAQAGADVMTSAPAQIGTYENGYSPEELPKKVDSKEIVLQFGDRIVAMSDGMEKTFGGKTSEMQNFLLEKSQLSDKELVDEIYNHLVGQKTDGHPDDVVFVSYTWGEKTNSSTNSTQNNNEIHSFSMAELKNLISGADIPASANLTDEVVQGLYLSKRTSDLQNNISNSDGSVANQIPSVGSYSVEQVKAAISADQGIAQLIAMFEAGIDDIDVPDIEYAIKSAINQSGSIKLAAESDITQQTQKPAKLNDPGIIAGLITQANNIVAQALQAVNQLVGTDNNEVAESYRPELGIEAEIEEIIAAPELAPVGNPSDDLDVEVVDEKADANLQPLIEKLSDKDQWFNEILTVISLEHTQMTDLYQLISQKMSAMLDVSSMSPKQQVLMSQIIEEYTVGYTNEVLESLSYLYQQINEPTLNSLIKTGEQAYRRQKNVTAVTAEIRKTIQDKFDLSDISPTIAEWWISRESSEIANVVVDKVEKKQQKKNELLSKIEGLEESVRYAGHKIDAVKSELQRKNDRISEITHRLAQITQERQIVQNNNQCINCSLANKSELPTLTSVNQSSIDRANRLLSQSSRYNTRMKEIKNRKQHNVHDYNIGDHIAQVVKNLEIPAGVKVDNLVIAAYLHDIGKVGADEANRRGLDPQRRGREPNHAEDSVTIAQQILNDLSISQEDKRQILMLVRFHEFLGNIGIYKNSSDQQKAREVYGAIPSETTEQAYKRYVRTVAKQIVTEDDVNALFAIAKADIAGVKKNGAWLTKETETLLRAARHEVLREFYVRMRDNAPNQATKNYYQVFNVYNRQMARIIRHESLLNTNDKSDANVFNLVLPTHRTDLNGTLGIIDTGLFYSQADRGVNFKIGGIASDYGFITFIGKGDDAAVFDQDDSLNILQMPGVAGQQSGTDLWGGFDDVVRQGNEAIVQATRERSMDWQGSAVVAPNLGAQFNIGATNEQVRKYENRIINMARKRRMHELSTVNQAQGIVPIEAISAIIIPKFVTKSHQYNDLVSLASRRNIKLLVAETGETALDYLGESAAYLLNDRSDRRLNNALGRFDQIIEIVEQELSARYHVKLTYSNNEEFRKYLRRYLFETGTLPKTFSNLNDNDIAQKIIDQNKAARLHRGYAPDGTSTRGGSYLNLAGQQAFSTEQELYFTYVANREFNMRINGMKDVINTKDLVAQIDKYNQEQQSLEAELAKLQAKNSETSRIEALTRQKNEWEQQKNAYQEALQQLDGESFIDEMKSNLQNVIDYINKNVYSPDPVTYILNMPQYQELVNIYRQTLNDQQYKNMPKQVVEQVVLSISRGQKRLADYEEVKYKKLISSIGEALISETTPQVISTRQFNGTSKVNIQLAEGNIGKANVDVVVNSANNYLANVSGTAGRISRASGIFPDDYSRRIMQSHAIYMNTQLLQPDFYVTRLQQNAMELLESRKMKPFQIGEVVLQSVPAAPLGGFKYVINAIGMGFDNDGRINMTSNSIYVSIKAALELADSKGLTSIALPIMGSGRGGVAIENSLNAMNQAIQETLPKLKHVKTIQIISTNNYESEAVKNVMNFEAKHQVKNQENINSNAVKSKQSSNLAQKVDDLTPNTDCDRRVWHLIPQAYAADGSGGGQTCGLLEMAAVRIAEGVDTVAEVAGVGLNYLDDLRSLFFSESEEPVVRNYSTEIDLKQPIYFERDGSQIVLRDQEGREMLGVSDVGDKSKADKLASIIVDDKKYIVKLEDKLFDAVSLDSTVEDGRQTLKEQVRLTRDFGHKAHLPELATIILNEQDEMVGYVMEAIPGRTLRQVIEANELTPELKNKILETVRDFHNVTGIAHGDLVIRTNSTSSRPNYGNIIIDDNGKVWIIDPIGKPLYGYVGITGPEDEYQQLEAKLNEKIRK